MKKRMQRADASGAKRVIILGDDEIDRGEVTLKDLKTGEQRPVALDAIAAALAQ